MDMLSFPAEVLENIFIFLDGHTFCQARLVCRTFNSVIKSMLSKNNLWKHFCLKEIPKSTLEEVLSFKCIPVTDTNWMNIYQCWFHSRMILTSPYWTKQIPVTLPFPVTCVKISGSWIITGHSNGHLCIWDSYTGDIYQNVLCHLKLVTDIALVDLLNLGYYYGSDEKPWSHHHVITISKDTYIRITSLLEPIVASDSQTCLNYHSDHLNNVRVFGSKFAVSCRDNTISVWNMKIVKNPYFDLEVSMLQAIVGPEDILYAFGFWYNEVRCVSHAGKLKVVKLATEKWIEEKYFKCSYTKYTDTTQNIFSVTSAFLFRSHVVIMLTANGKMIVSVDSKQNRHYYLMHSFRTTLTSVALCGPMLLLGGENGKLFLYDIGDGSKLMNLELNKPDLSLLLSEASITSIDISYQLDSPIIVASSSDSLYVIKWYKQNSILKVKKKYIIV